MKNAKKMRLVNAYVDGGMWFMAFMAGGFILATLFALWIDFGTVQGIRAISWDAIEYCYGMSKLEYYQRNYIMVIGASVITGVSNGIITYKFGK